MIESVRKKLSSYKEVYFDGTCYYFNKEKLLVKFSGHFYRFQQFNEKYLTEQNTPLISIVSPTEEVFDVQLSHYYQPKIKADGFKLKIKSDASIKVETSNMRGFRYAIQVLSSLINLEENQIVLPIIEVNHEPSFEIRGVIEGFYGIPWTAEDRIDVMHYMGRQRLNTYMYAPKDDELQRKRWREPYPEAKLEEFKQLLDVAEEEEIDFYYMISPGNDIDYTQPSEVEVLTEKLQSMINLGIRYFGLLLDDIDYILKGNAKLRFKDAASAHAYLINEVDHYLATVLTDYELVVCPTEYDNRFASQYLDELTQAVAPHVPFFWTGPSTLAREIRTSDIARCAETYNRPIIVWDNTPVNDFENDHELLFLSPFENRSPQLADSAYNVRGFVSNPMAQWEASKLTVGHMSHYLWNSEGFNFIGDWETVLEGLAGKTSLEALKIFARFNPNRHTRQVYPDNYLRKVDQQDVAFIESKLTELRQACEQLTNLSDESLLQQLKPWLDRALQDITFWNVIRTKDQDAIHKLAKELSGSSYRIGLDLPMKYYERHFATETE